MRIKNSKIIPKNISIEKNLKNTPMNKFIIKLLLVTVSVTLFYTAAAQNNHNTLVQTNVWSFEQLEKPRLAEGLAGSFFGRQGSYFIMAGGSSFPDGKPWHNGAKTFSDLALVFSQNRDGSFQLLHRQNALPSPMAEGAYASVAAGVLCIGGQTPDGLTAQTLLISYNGNEVSVTELPPLPAAVRNATATTIGSTVYLVGGELADGSSVSQFLMLDANNPDRGWQPLPDFPYPVSGATVTAQQDGEEIAVYVFGGRSRNQAETTTFFPSVYRYKPSSRKWDKRGDIRLADNTPLPLAMSTAASVGASHILIYGGDSGETFNRVETAINHGQTAVRDSLWQRHAGFNNKILVYNTITDEWFTAGETRNAPVAVTSDATDGKSVYVAGGEIRPGVRSPYITQLTFVTKTHFGWLNYLVLIVYFGAMLMLGFFFMKKESSTDDFFKASGRIPWWAAGISIFATTLSAITFISIPAKTYATDWRMLVFNLTIILIAPIVIRYFLPFFRRFSFETAYEYLEMRFNRVVRWLASALFTLFMVSRVAIVLFLPSLALNAVTGFSVYYAILIMGVVTIIYCTSGGMEAVVWGDVIQGFILIAGALAAFVFMVMGVDGGLGEFWRTSVEFNKFHTFDFRFDLSQPVFWVVLVGGLANTLISYTSDQSVVQRYMTTKDEKATARSIWLNGIISVPVSILFFLLGTGLFAFYKSNAASMAVTNPNIDSVFPQFIVSEIPAGFAGLLIAAIFAAAMSTLSSNINSVAAVVTSDFYKTLRSKTSLKGSMAVARWSGIIVGLLGIGMALVLATWNIASLWDQFNTFLGLLTSGLGALFILGIFFPRVNAWAALAGIAGGIIVLTIVQNDTQLSFLLYGFIGMAASIVIALIISLIVPNKKQIKGYTWKSIEK